MSFTSLSSLRFVLIVMSLAFVFVDIYITLLGSFLQVHASLPEEEIEVSKITTGQGACGVVVDSRDNMLYVTNHKANTLSVINGSTSSVVKDVDVPGIPCGLAIDYKTNVVYVISEGGDQIYSMDRGNNTIRGNFSVNRPYEMVVNSETGTLYVTSDANDRVYSIDLDTAKILSTLLIPDPCGIAIDIQNNIVFVSSENSGSVHVIDGSANQVRATIPVGEGPRGLAFNPETNVLLVANTASDSVSVIDNLGQRVVSTIGVDKAPRRIAVNPDTNIAYVIGQNTLNFLDLSSYSVIRSVPLQSSYEIALNTDENLVYVTNSNSDFVYVIEGYEREIPSPFPYADLIIAVLGIAAGAGIIVLVWRKKQGQKTRQGSATLA